VILPALPHFWEATSNVSQPSEGAADAETSAEAERRGNLLSGTSRAAERQQAAGLGRCMPGQVRMGPPMARGVGGGGVEAWFSTICSGGLFFKFVSVSKESCPVRNVLQLLLREVCIAGSVWSTCLCTDGLFLCVTASYVRRHKEYRVTPLNLESRT